MPAQLQCPVCSYPLNETASGAACRQNHQFDRARQGYLNLLPSHKKRSKQPGDDKHMVQARSRFLDSGHYAPVVKALVQTTVDALSETASPLILDAGCGEGYYTWQLHNALSPASLCGFDISKPAIQSCCRRSKIIQWLVASVNDIPLANHQVDVIISVFSRCDWKEFQRVLKPGGKVLILAPGEQHLYALRQVIYEEVRPYSTDKLLSQLPESLTLDNNKAVTGTMLLDSPEIILDLLAMTPHYWHVKPSQRQRLSELSSLECGIDMMLYTLTYQPAENLGFDQY